MIRAFADATGWSAPPVPAPAPGGVVLWRPGTAALPLSAHEIAPRGERRRHVRKYAQGELGADKSFYFRGPRGRLNLRAQNLMLFVQLSLGVDDETWCHHLKRGDYSRWLREAIKDEDLALEVAAIEARRGLSAVESRGRVREAIERRYTLPS